MPKLCKFKLIYVFGDLNKPEVNPHRDPEIVSQKPSPDVAIDIHKPEVHYPRDPEKVSR